MKVLFVGESWINILTEIKGFDSFSLTSYCESCKWLKGALESNGITVNYIPTHMAPINFPFTIEEISEYEVVILSDIGSNTLLLTKECTDECKAIPNRLELIKNYVNKGGGFLMIGGWMSFQGIDGKAHYKHTAIEEILPVTMIDGDDRMEVCQGINPVKVADHPIVKGLEKEWPQILSYNKLIPKDKAQILAAYEDDPLFVAWEYGKGRSVASAFDCAPHGAPYEFLEWEGYSKLWGQTVRWLAKEL